MHKRRTIPQSLLIGSLLVASASPLWAGGKIKIDDTRWISIGAGLRTSAASVSDAAPDGSSRASNFNLESARLYIAGQVSDQFKLYFGTEKMFGDYGVLDAIVQYEPSKKFNIWMGRMLTPADRIEMNGPFYGLSWNQYTVPLYPSDNDPANGANGRAGTYGRDEGVTVWGSLNKFQYAIGVFNGISGPANQSDAPLFAVRFAYNFLDKEANPAYYTSSTYFGTAGNILTLGVSAQYQDDGYGTATDSGSFTGYAIDGLFEKPLSNGGTITVEGEYKSFDVSTQAATPNFAMFDGDAYFLTVAYLISGRHQPYIRVTNNDPTNGDSSDLTEIGMNYVISGHNLRLNLNYTTGDANASGEKGADVDTISFGMQVQL